MLISGDEPDLLSEINDFDLVRHLLADLHDDLSGKVARFRQLVDLSDALGSSGTMLFGGDITDSAWREARWSFIHGNFVRIHQTTRVTPAMGAGVTDKLWDLSDMVRVMKSGKLLNS
jgi:endonuclease/exonuclease/phosphatase (EEP) superfamily protein YafD